MKQKLSKLLVPAVYVVAVGLIITSVILIINGVNNYSEKEPETKYNYSPDPGQFDDTVPVVGKEDTIIRPYVAEDVKIGKYFYDFEGDKEEQEKSIVYFENTYMQNSGVDYTGETPFDVVSILDGEVTSIKKDATLGNIIQIKHNDDLISVYQGVDSINVEEGAQVSQGDVIAISGTSTINPNYKTSLHFEIYYQGQLMDPENFYSLSIDDFR